MRLALIAATFMLGLSAGASAIAQEAPRRGDPILGERLIEGLATADRLWVRGNQGAVVSFERETGARTILVTGGVVDLVREGGQTVALREVRPNAYVVENLDSGEALTTEVVSEAKPLALVRTGPRWLILTRETLITETDTAWVSCPLSETLDEFGVPTIAASRSGMIYVGFNQGEWGGGLRKIDPLSGTVGEVRRVDEDPCDGPLAHECDPVTGIIQDPSHPDCMLVSVGLMHMIAHGRILRVCDETVEVIYERAVPPPSNPNAMVLPHTWPFFGLASTEGGWVAISAGKLFRSVGGEVQQSDMPSLTPWHGLDASFDDPAVVVLKTDVNWGMSLSGYTPLLVPITD